MRNPVYAETISKAIMQLHKDFPGLPIGEHIANALQGMDVYNISDKDFAKLLTEYWATLQLDDYYTRQEANPDEYNE